jgi:methanogenic corrinoid protein MtbC1
VSEADDRGALAGALAVRDRGVRVDEVLRGLVVPAQLRVGELWAGNEWTVAREHAATAIGEAVVRRLAEDLPQPATGPLLTVACVEREWHALPALVVATTLRAHGFRVDYLGASASRDHLVSRILDSGPAVVLLSASLTSSLPRARRHIEAVRGTGTPVLVGGHAFDRAGDRARRLGATAYAPSPEVALAQLDTLPQHVSDAPPLRHRGATEARTIAAEHESVVRDVMTETDRVLGLSGGGEAALAPDDWRVVLATFVPHVVESLEGALLTEDRAVMDETRAWLDVVLERRAADPRAVAALVDALADRLADLPETQLMLR